MSSNYSIPPAMEKPVLGVISQPAIQPHHHSILAHAAEIFAGILGVPLAAGDAIRSRGLEDVVPLVAVEIARRYLVIAPRFHVDGDDFGRRKQLEREGPERGGEWALGS